MGERNMITKPSIYVTDKEVNRDVFSKTLSVPIDTINEILDAITYATLMHGNQKRRHTNEPYITHCISVLKHTLNYTNSLNACLIAILHDTVEDTDASIDDIRAQWGYDVSEGVNILTNTPTTQGLNRIRRKSIGRARTSESTDIIQTIRMFDILDNIPSLRKYESYFFNTVFKKEVIDDILAFDKVDTTLSFKVLAELNK